MLFFSFLEYNLLASLISFVSMFLACGKIDSDLIPQLRELQSYKHYFELLSVFIQFVVDVCSVKVPDNNNQRVWVFCFFLKKK